MTKLSSLAFATPAILSSHPITTRDNNALFAMVTPPPSFDAAPSAPSAMFPPFKTSSSYSSSAYASLMSSYTPATTNELMEGIKSFLLPPPAFAATTNPKPPSNDEIKLLRSALGALYGERNPEKAEVLLTEAVQAWQRQNPDERAALYRVRGDCYMALLKPEEAASDYGIAVELLEGPGGELADPEERPAARLGRARALRASSDLSPQRAATAASDYRVALLLTSREEWDTDSERIEDGASRNPYAAWEWASARRESGDYKGAAESHVLASIAFAEVGDKPRSVISNLDAGIDLAAVAASTGDANDVKEARTLLEKAIASTVAVEGRDVELLQRIIAKEGEARIALASILWSNGDKGAAEAQLGEACVRLDQLEADAQAREAARIKSGAMPPPKIQKLKFSIDDGVSAGEIGCSRFKSDKFLSESLRWPEVLRVKVDKLQKLGR
mmetsp:Transcript_20498/g.30190  ORF Transcript_20498/g.30190 Transcript_20498/m.30190 type:complete len:445 (+) Transcript_20498:79-1413(+)